MSKVKFDKLWRLDEGLNAFTFNFEERLLEEIRTEYHQIIHAVLQQRPETLEGGDYYSEPIAQNQYFLLSFDDYPLIWVSANQADKFAIFQRFFDALEISKDVKKLVKHRKRIVMYCGFLVIGNQSPAAKWHYDYRPGAQAYTLITPLFSLDPGHGNLLYQIDAEATGTYVYHPGEAIIFGEGFMHSTEPYPAGPLRVLLSLTFGTDKWDSWPILRKNIEYQSTYYALPCGHIAGTCRCLEPKRRLWDFFTGRRAP